MNLWLDAMFWKKRCCFSFLLSWVKSFLLQYFPLPGCDFDNCMKSFENIFWCMLLLLNWDKIEIQFWCLCHRFKNQAFVSNISKQWRKTVKSENYLTSRTCGCEWVWDLKGDLTGRTEGCALKEVEIQRWLILWMWC